MSKTPNRKKSFVFITSIFTWMMMLHAGHSYASNTPDDQKVVFHHIDSLYNHLQPADTRPAAKVFRDGMIGYYAIKQKNLLENNRYITLIDFSLPSTERRLWVIDLENLQIVQHSLVAHGRNTGGEFAVNFSNTISSKMSSLGFYLTGSTYHGKYGLSLYLDGIEPEINDNARKRTIVMHSAPYVTPKFIAQYGRLGRSYGCPAVPPSKSKAIIQTIKDKSCLFIYYPVPSYFAKSKYLGDQLYTYEGAANSSM